MASRLSPADTAFYQRENTATPMYVGSLSILRRPRGGLSYERLLETVERQLPMVPRYRQKIREVTFGLARPVWVDDPDFDITYHVRRSALPSPGSDSQLHELVSRLAGRPMDRARPLWEMYLIEGLSKSRLAVFIKSHQALVNGLTALELGHVIADRQRRPPPAAVDDIWLPRGEPSSERLLIDAVGDWLARPGQQIRSLRSTVAGVAANTGELAQIARRTVEVARRLALGSAPQSPLNTTVSRHRRFTVAAAELSDYRKVRARYDCDVNDVVLTVITGALRNWLLSRGEPVPGTSVMRAMAPTSVYPEAELPSGPGQAITEVAPFLIALPVGEANPVVRLSQIAHATETLSADISLVEARTIVTLSGFPPPTLHAMGTRVATAYPARQFNLLITNVPGPQTQIHLAGATLLETYAVPPLLHDQVLAIGVTSYCGMLYFGINADRDAMADVEMFPELLAEALEELLEAAQ